MEGKIIVTIEKTDTGYSAFYNYNTTALVATEGKDFPELFQHLSEATIAMEIALNEEIKE